MICGATVLGNDDIRCGLVAVGPCPRGQQHKAFIAFEGIYRWTGDGDDLTLQRPNLRIYPRK